MCQKSGLLACFLSDKDLLILDEPTDGLDVKARACFKHYLQQMKAAGKTIFLTTHLLSDIESLCDNIAVLHDGYIRFYGTTQTCMETFAADDLESAYLNCIR
jgi:ABC-2 type transport system ATP-binding protein